MLVDAAPGLADLLATKDESEVRHPAPPAASPWTPWLPPAAVPPCSWGCGSGPAPWLTPACGVQILNVRRAAHLATQVLKVGPPSLLLPARQQQRTCSTSMVLAVPLFSGRLQGCYWARAPLVDGVVHCGRCMR